ncbi:hypothetical protein G7046_g5376 [Stylonectria norvegica]|nr:hypothetical protein G7046_g5376 [Stylonectria norvegica]
MLTRALPVSLRIEAWGLRPPKRPVQLRRVGYHQLPPPRAMTRAAPGKCSTTSPSLERALLPASNRPDRQTPTPGIKYRYLYLGTKNSINENKGTGLASLGWGPAGISPPILPQKSPPQLNSRLTLAPGNSHPAPPKLCHLLAVIWTSAIILQTNTSCFHPQLATDTYRISVQYALHHLAQLQILANSSPTGKFNASLLFSVSDFQGLASLLHGSLGGMRSGCYGCRYRPPHRCSTPGGALLAATGPGGGRCRAMDPTNFSGVGMELSSGAHRLHGRAHACRRQQPRQGTSAGSSREPS